MSHIYKCSEWKSGSGRWMCGDVEDLAQMSGAWWVPARVLNISLTDYILLLKNQYNATHMTYNKESNVLHFSFDNYADCHRYVLYINKVARNRKYYIY